MYKFKLFMYVLFICLLTLSAYGMGNRPPSDEKDPIFSRSPASAITNGHIEAIQNFEEVDPKFSASPASRITEKNLTDLSTFEAYITQEMDPVYTSSPAATMTSSDLDKLRSIGTGSSELGIPVQQAPPSLPVVNKTLYINSDTNSLCFYTEVSYGGIRTPMWKAITSGLAGIPRPCEAINAIGYRPEIHVFPMDKTGIVEFSSCESEPASFGISISDVDNNAYGEFIVFRTGDDPNADPSTWTYSDLKRVMSFKFDSSITEFEFAPTLGTTIINKGEPDEEIFTHCQSGISIKGFPGDITYAVWVGYSLWPDGVYTIALSAIDPDNNIANPPEAMPFVILYRYWE